ncbi:MAG: hypothetical protein HYY09_02600 [Firmicutes bacterium]|nr:hypothetical protein [Bacillota bacterium]
MQLGAHPHPAFSRSHLAPLLWKRLDEAGGRNNLTTTLTRLRQALPAHADVGMVWAWSDCRPGGADS